MTAAVVLAAGASRRLGRPKQTVMLGGEMLVERAVRVAIEAGLSPVIVVVRPGADFAQSLQQLGAILVTNDQAEEGMAASIRLGVNVARTLKATAALVMACDQPGLTAAHLRALCAQPDRMTGSSYAGRIGVPAYFPVSAFPLLIQLQGDSGARQILRSAASIPCEALALDIDTPEDLEQAEHLSKSR
jgi:CTP:molybdopterin cytidylyltransferase MocA